MKVPAVVHLIALVLALAPTVLEGAPPRQTERGVDIEQLLAENRHPVALSNSVIVGAGADLLLEAAREAQSFLIGEQHDANITGGAPPPLLQPPRAGSSILR